MPAIQPPVYLAEKVFTVILLAILIPAATALVWQVGHILWPRASCFAWGTLAEDRGAKLLGVVFAGLGGVILLAVATVLAAYVLAPLPPEPGPIPLVLALGVVFMVTMLVLSCSQDNLIENLFKLGIIFVLFLILVPVFRQAREKARAQTCRTHLKQVGAAMRMYADDHDGRLPLRANWCDAVLPYVPASEHRPARRVFRCPSLRNQPSGQAYNAQLSGLSASRLTSPSTTTAVFDARGGWNLAGGSEQAIRRHNNGLCLLFTDGHARWLKSLDGVVWKPASTLRGRER